MHPYDARQQFIEGLDRYVSGIENDRGLQRSKYTIECPPTQSTW